MPGPARKSGRRRRRRAKITGDFATGEVHDRALDAAGDPRAIAQAQGAIAPDEAPSPEEFSNEDRAQLGADAPGRGTRARHAGRQASRRWVKARKIP